MGDRAPGPGATAEAAVKALSICVKPKSVDTSRLIVTWRRKRRTPRLSRLRQAAWKNDRAVSTLTLLRPKRGGGIDSARATGRQVARDARYREHATGSGDPRGKIAPPGTKQHCRKRS
jgi:hypothetical protein